jgi:pimeloyl-ACP methyl ester carboxylesterase
MNPEFPRLASTERTAERATGPVVVFMHGLGCERTQFAAQLAGLDHRLQLLSLDLPGHGESAPFRDQPHGIRSIADAVVVDLADRGYSDLILVGHSAGGLVALRIAATRADLVRGAVLLDTNIALTDSEIEINRNRSAESDNDNWRNFFMTSMVDAWGDAGATIRRDVFRALERTPADVARPFWHDILTFQSENLWRKMSVPVLYVRSRRKTDLALLRSLNELIFTSDLQPCCNGHWPHLQCSPVVNRLLHEFFARLKIIDDQGYSRWMSPY